MHFLRFGVAAFLVSSVLVGFGCGGESLPARTEQMMPSAPPPKRYPKSDDVAAMTTPVVFELVNRSDRPFYLRTGDAIRLEPPGGINDPYRECGGCSCGGRCVPCEGSFISRVDTLSAGGKQIVTWSGVVFLRDIDFGRGMPHECSYPSSAPAGAFKATFRYGDAFSHCGFTDDSVCPDGKIKSVTVEFAYPVSDKILVELD